MRITENYDIIRNRHNIVDDILLLHPSLIEKELSKIEEHCPIYMIENNGIIHNILIPNKPIQEQHYTNELKYSIPEDVIIPIGGIDGKYYIKTYGTYIDRKTKLTQDKGYSVIDKNSNRSVYEGDKLSYLGRNVAIIDNLYITKNNIIFHKDYSMIFYETGYMILGIKTDEERVSHNMYALYDPEGNFICTNHSDFTYDKMTEIASNAQILPSIDLPKNTTLFEQMIISSLKDRKELIGSDANNLIDIVNYLQSKNIEIAIDLKSLGVYKVNYKKYFNYLELFKEIDNTGPKRVRKK